MAGKLEFVRTGLTLNQRVYLAGEVVDAPDGFEPMSPEEQLEYYGKTFYTETTKALTDPRAFQPRPDMVEPEYTPQIASSRGEGSTEVGGGSTSFTPAISKGVVPRSALPDVPVLDGKKSTKASAELGETEPSDVGTRSSRPTLKLKRSSRRSEEPEPVRKKTGKKKRHTLAKATKLQD